ncbi:hypothetical protein ABZ178_32560 [Streptomyces massasporeus]|uniref:hypothetical protein n=1 Tax=Streptomyces massasporeus TaxID=67324 RepID=UPI001E293A77|nr:hypothetical protein [Streptomyces massasporeus]
MRRQEKAEGGISWTTLLLVAGVMTYMAMLEKAGTVENISEPGSSGPGTWHPESAPAGAPWSRGRSTLEATAGNQP